MMTRWRCTGDLTFCRAFGFVLGLWFLSSGTAQAQWGWGFGWMPYTPPSVEMLNARSNIMTSRAASGQQPSLQVPDRFAYRQQQIEMMDRRDVSSRRGLDSYISRTPTPPPPRPADSRPGVVQGQVPQAPMARPVLPITSFFDPNQELVWPADAPTAGDLGSLRNISDDASRVVLMQFEADGRAKLASVTDARLRLLDYGQPALSEIRERSTPRIADAFHLFLLSLYDSLGQAADPPPST
ncbi:hypothetical protein BH23PLA1_BH23PLA1_31570 [soil metagenome]